MSETKELKTEDQLKQSNNPTQEVKLNIQRIYVRGSTFEAFNMSEF